MANDELYYELRRLAKRANQRILRLEREFGFETGVVKRLRFKLDSQVVNAWTRGGRVRYNKSMSEKQMKATIKALNDFNASIQSRVSGARKLFEYRRQQIAKAFDLSEEEVENGDVEKFFEIAAERRSRILELIDPSRFFALVQEAKDINATFEQWIKILEQEIEIGNDKELIADAYYLYNKYVR